MIRSALLIHRAPHDDISEPIASYIYSLVVAPVIVTDLDLGSPTSEAGPRSVNYSVNVELEMPVEGRMQGFGWGVILKGHALERIQDFPKEEV